MARCPNGHDCAEGHQFCGECGVPLAAGFEEYQGGTDVRSSSTIPRSEIPSDRKLNWRQGALAGSYRSNLIAAIVASVGVAVGSTGPWTQVLMFNVNGLDFQNWGVATLVLGAIAGVTLFTQLNWAKTPFNRSLAIPLAWGSAVSGVACLTIAAITIVRLKTASKADLFGIEIGPGVGWGLWIVAFSSAVLCVTASIVAVQTPRTLDESAGAWRSSWVSGWKWAAIVSSAVISVSGVAYAWANPLAAEDSPSGGEQSTFSAPTPTLSPSFPSLPSSTATQTIPSMPAPTTSARSASHNKTIQDYLKENNIQEAAVHRGDPGSPNFDLPFPPDWSDAGRQTPEWAYGAIVYDKPEVPADPPSIIALVSKLTGNVDPAKILELAPGELKNLPQYEPRGDDNMSTLSGFDAVQLGGTYMKDGKKRIIAQKTVVIPRSDGLYVLQMNADALDGQENVLIDATNVIDEKTTITP